MARDQDQKKQKPARKSRGKKSRESPRHEQFTTRLDLDPRDLELYRMALTHRSAIRNRPSRSSEQPSEESYERLEFLGDAILGAIVTEALYRKFPDEAEGELTRRRSGVVRTEQLAEWANELEMFDALYLAPGERASDSGRDRILAGAYEALIGAIYLDRGINATRKFVNQQLKRDLGAIVESSTTSNPKGRLQEVTQELHRRTPSYRTIEEVGPAHAKMFTVEVRFKGNAIASGTGSTKRAAEESAASAALLRMEDEGMDVLLND